MKQMVQIFLQELKKQSFSIMVLLLGVVFVYQQNKQFYEEVQECHTEQIDLMQTTIKDNTKSNYELSNSIKTMSAILKESK